jgi:hypothetical protein
MRLILAGRVKWKDLPLYLFTMNNHVSGRINTEFDLIAFNSGYGYFDIVTDGNYFTDFTGNEFHKTSLLLN